MITLDSSIRRIRQLLRPADGPTAAARRRRALLPPPRFIDCMELEDRTLLSATPLGVETLVNTETAGGQQTFAESPQAVASDSSGNYVVAWSSQDQDGSGWGVYAQLFDSAGVAQGGELQVHTATANDQQYASVAMAANGRFVVAWTTDAAGDAGVRARVFDSAGVAQTGEIQVNTYTLDDQHWQSIAMDDSGNFVITWTSINQDGSGYGIFARQFDSSGAGQADFQVNTTTAGDQLRSQVAMDADGDFVIVWESDAQDGSGLGIYGRRYNAAGAAQSGEFVVNSTTAGDQRSASVDMDAAGNFAVTWTTGGAGAMDTRVQRFDSTGVAQGGETAVNDTVAGDQQHSRIAITDSGEFIISWSSFNQDSAGTWGIYAKKFTAAGAVAQPEIRVNTTTAGDQYFSSVAVTPSGNAIVVWSGNGPGDADGVFMQRYHFNDVPVVTATGSALAYTENAGAVAIDSALAVSDADDVNLQGATITIAGNYVNGQDILSFTDQSGITGNWSAAAGTLTLSGSSSVANYQAALRSITYTNTSDNPSTALRTVSFVVHDGTVNSVAATRDISIASLNDAPALAGIEGAAVVYIENGSSLVTSSITVSDLDNTTLAGATVQITGNYVNGQDLLTFTNTPNITGSWDGASGTLTLNGVDTLANYQAALRNVGYANSSDNPNTATRTVTFRANDGAANSNSLTRDVAITAVNDAPVNNLPGPQSTAEDTPLVFSNGNGNLISVSDVDAAGNALQVTLTATDGVVTLSQTNGLSFTSGDGSTDGVMTFTGTFLDINAALDGLSFTPANDFNGNATLQLIVNDQGHTGGGALSDSDSVAISVGSLNDGPTIAAPGPQAAQAQSLVFSSAGGNAIRLDDIDAGGAALELTLVATNGTITLGSTSGISFVQGTGAGDSTMVLQGTLADLNGALNGLSFHVSSSGAAQLAITLNDLGNTGAGGAASASQSIDISDSAPMPPPPPPPPTAPPTDGGSGGATGATSPQEPGSDTATVTAAVIPAPAPRPSDNSDLDRPAASRSLANQSSGLIAATLVSPARTFRLATTDVDPSDYRSFAQHDALRAKTLLVDRPRLLADFAPEQMLSNELREMREALDSAFASPWTYGAVAGLGALSAGYLVWGLQAGSLVTSALSSLPIWGSFDPLPVLEFWERDSKRNELKKPDEDDPLWQSEPAPALN
jgi:hypothetical protein